MKILLVEDDEKVRAALERVLRKDGHEIVWAADAPGAIRQLVSEPGLELILLDMTLANGTTGWSVAEFRANDARSKAIPLVVLSGADPRQLQARARQNWLEGVSLMLDKPPDFELLRRYIESLKA